MRHAHELSGRGAGGLAAHRNAIARDQHLLDLPLEVGDGLVTPDDRGNDLFASAADIVSPAGLTRTRASRYGSFVTATCTVPSASAITRSVLASNSTPTSRRSVTAASTRTPSTLLRKSAIAASMLLRAFAVSGTRSTVAFSASDFSRYEIGRASGRESVKDV